MNQLKLKYGERCKTESTNPAVLRMYDYLLENENVDTDYWWLGFGPEDLTIIFENNFTELDWKELQKDLKNWTTFQLEIFIYAIMNGYDYNLIQGDLEKERPDQIEKQIHIISNKTDLILPILNIGRERGWNNEIISTACDEIHFITDHFDILLKYDINYLNKIKHIIEIIGVDSVLRQNPDLKDKIERASR